ncbi:MAG: methyltetrahydrofolate cobalamin methyltransferase [Anaerolineae bacterium]|nr:methyltetrahydrofolate cobalamin methyltransferase [Anaerolineae bacterium]MDW8067751.1 methyltetrahydrofolate cobalamin methyltransferase [Anaerolineae bacterium]
MLIIGEKINGTLKKVGQAVLDRDGAFIQDLARRQAEAGADYIDVNAGTPAAREPEDLVWLVETVQAVTELPLCLDSANPKALAAALERTARPPLINSISGEESRLTEILPLVPGRAAGVIAMLLDDTGMPQGVEDRLRVAHRILERTRAAGIPDEQVYIDPLVMAVATQQDGALVALKTMRTLRAQYPDVRFSVGLSNVSFGLPVRTLVNQAFLTLALYEGLDAAIMDPLDRGVMGMLLAAEVVLGRDRFCRRYVGAYRSGHLGRPQ